MTPRFPEAEVAAALDGSVTLLGCGTFGDTWRQGDTAVKIICADGYPPERVSREVDGLSRVNSPHVVRLLDTRTVELGGKRRPALVFEYVAGGDLTERIDEEQWPTVSEGIALLHGLLIGIRDLHATHTVHRDIKPGNVALREGDWTRPVILDLGLARGIDDPTITIYPGPIGTALYMAPEQLKGNRARKAADLFAIGVTVRELLGRRHPFYADGIEYTYDEAITKIATGPSTLSENLPGPIVELLDRLVASAEHERGSVTSSLRRLDLFQKGGSRD